MEFHQLRYFCAVVRSGTFTRAAESEHVAQPSLSQQILKLEDELGAKLFERLPREARLTSFGTVFLPRAQAILRQMLEARTEIQQLAALTRVEPKQPVRVAETVEVIRYDEADKRKSGAGKNGNGMHFAKSA